MARAPVYLISTLSKQYRSYILKDDAHVLLFTHRRWGEPVTRDWMTPELVLLRMTLDKQDADFAGLPFPGLVVATREAGAEITFPELELIPVLAGSEEHFVLNPHISVRRFRPEGADIAQVPGGAVVGMQKADFHLEDLPRHACCFWFNDGRSARFLLCNEGFRQRVESAKLTGLSFRLLGHAV
jgi:hypothetical protein